MLKCLYDRYTCSRVPDNHVHLLLPGIAFHYSYPHPYVGRTSGVLDRGLRMSYCCPDCRSCIASHIVLWYNVRTQTERTFEMKLAIELLAAAYLVSWVRSAL